MSFWAGLEWNLLPGAQPNGESKSQYRRWFFGVGSAIIYLAGIQAIPEELYEAAKIDGATLWQRIRYVTIPMLRHVIIFTVFLSTIGALQLFTEPLVYLGRSFREEGITVVLYLWRDAFVNNAFGTASATAVILFFIILLFTSINVKLSNRIGK